MNNLFVFGDSWAWGSELEHPEKQRFSHILSNQFDLIEKNYSRPNSSLFEINYKILTQTPVNSFVVVIIPPDSRISNIQDGFKFDTVHSDSEQYEIFSKNNGLEYFEWNHNLLINSICHNLASNKNKFLLMKNYGELNLMTFNEKWKHYILGDSLHSILNAKKPTFQGYVMNLRDWGGPSFDDFSGKYFEGCDCHPNKLGHEKIAEIIKEKMQW